MLDDQKPVTIALVPLDERPVNTRYPQMLGAIGGARVLLPPPEVRGLQRVPADVAAVGAWLREAANKADGIIVSADYLVYGNLINARISTASAAEVLPRLHVLEAVGAQPKPIYAFGLITRVSNADDCVEEPPYWATWGTRFYRYSQLLHKREQEALDDADAQTFAVLEAELPPALVADWLGRRLRNHTVNLVLLDLLARDKISFLLLTSDDTSPWGLPTREKRWLESWGRVLGPRVEGRTKIHPGADEVGSALVARLLCHQHGMEPSVWPLYAVPNGEEIVAPYEDRAVRITVEGQIEACGCKLATSANEADIVLGVLPPSPRRTEFRADFAQAERAEREPFYADFFTRLGLLQQAGRPVALGDVAYPNGADPLAIELLLDPSCALDPARLAAFGAWNTAGNTLGVVVAQAACSLLMKDHPEREQAQAVFLAHRFLEDWGYQTIVRRAARAHLAERYGHQEPDPDDPAQVETASRFIEHELTHALGTLQARGIGAGLRITPGSVRLPWRRTFEVDFDLYKGDL